MLHFYTLLLHLSNYCVTFQLNSLLLISFITTSFIYMLRKHF